MNPHQLLSPAILKHCQAFLWPHLAAAVRDPTCDPWDQNLKVGVLGGLVLGSLMLKQKMSNIYQQKYKHQPHY